MAKYITFVKDDAADVRHEGRPIYWIANKRSNQPIGQVFWYPPWKQWTARFKEDSVWSQDCLADVREFLLVRNREQP